jgi:hypothetical protein
MRAFEVSLCFGNYTHIIRDFGHNAMVRPIDSLIDLQRPLRTHQRPLQIPVRKESLAKIVQGYGHGRWSCPWSFSSISTAGLR